MINIVDWKICTMWRNQIILNFSALYDEIKNEKKLKKNKLRGHSLDVIITCKIQILFFIIYKIN